MTMVLAQYSIRSKQEYIFRSNKILEIVGASEHISNAWDCLMKEAKKAGLLLLELDATEKFEFEKVKNLFESGTLQLVELFRGGGNETILFDKVETFVKLNKAFSRYLLENCPGMIPMAVCVEASGDYKEDYKKLMESAEKEKQKMISGQSHFILPFSMMDRTCFQPYSEVVSFTENGKTSDVRLTAENSAKRRTGWEKREQDSTVRLLDSMITKKGEESLLAVIHADGNNMGNKIQTMLGNHTDYDFCINKMRAFTKATDQVFVVNGIEALVARKKELEKKYPKMEKGTFAIRKLIADGDDITFICNARFAMEYTDAYLKSVQQYQKDYGSEWEYSSCAGICIFHSHYPFARAYSIAEQACDDGAKKKVHVIGQTIEESWVDYHYIHSGIGGNLMGIRAEQGTLDCMARPWLVAGGNDQSEQHYNKLSKLDELLKKNHVSRSDIKTIGSELEYSFALGEVELERIYGHHPDLRRELSSVFSSVNQLLKAIYDYAEVFDLWFKEGA